MLFSDTNFWRAESNSYYMETVIERGTVVEQWVYQQGTAEEAMARRSIDAFDDRNLYTFSKTSIDRDAYRAMKQSASGPKIIEHGHLVTSRNLRMVS